MSLRPHWLSVVVALGVLVSSPPAWADDHVTVAGAAATTTLIAAAGIQEGLFKQQKLDVELKRVAGGNVSIQALVSGAIQFAEGSDAQFVSAAAKDLPVVAVALHSHGFTASLIAEPRYGNLKTLADFKGKRIGIQVGTGVYTVFLMTLERQNLKPSDFVLNNIQVNDMPAAMQSGSFDAVLAWEPQASRIVQAKLGVRVISTQQFEELADITYPFILMTTRGMVEKHPDIVQRYVRGFASAQHFVDMHHAECAQMFRGMMPPDTSAKLSDADVLNQIYGVSRYDRLLFSPKDMADLERTRDFLVAQKILSSRPDLANFIDMKFAQHAAEAAK